MVYSIFAEHVAAARASHSKLETPLLPQPAMLPSKELAEYIIDAAEKEQADFATSLRNAGLYLQDPLDLDVLCDWTSYLIVDVTKRRPTGAGSCPIDPWTS